MVLLFKTDTQLYLFSESSCVSNSVRWQKYHSFVRPLIRSGSCVRLLTGHFFQRAFVRTYLHAFLIVRLCTQTCTRPCVLSRSFVVYVTHWCARIDLNSLCRGAPPGGRLYMKGSGMLVASLRDANQELWSHLGWRNSKPFSCQGIYKVRREKKIENKKIMLFWWSKSNRRNSHWYLKLEPRPDWSPLGV